MRDPIANAGLKPPRSTRRQLAALLAIGLAAFAVIVIGPRAWHARPTISDAGFESTTYIVIGGSRVSDQQDGQFKESLLRVEGGNLRGVGSIVRVARQHRGQPLTCLGQRYEADRYWTSSSPAAGRIEFRDTETLALIGTIELTVTVDEVVRRPLAVDPMCQTVTGTYRGIDGVLAGVAGSVSAGFAPGRVDQF